MNKYQEALDDIKCDSYNCVENDYENNFQQCYKKQFKLLQELVDKATPKKPKTENFEDDRYNCYKHACPTCGYRWICDIPNYCPECGQRLGD